MTLPTTIWRMTRMSKPTDTPTKVITGICRASYANIWEPKSINGSNPKYSVSIIIPKSDTVTLNAINAAIKAAYQEGQSKLKGNGKSVPKLADLKTPLRDGDDERPDDEAYADSYLSGQIVLHALSLKQVRGLCVVL